MKKFILVLMVLLAVQALADHRNEFRSFMRRFHKIYGKDEFPRRYRIFSENMQIAESMNGGSAVYGTTKFSDLTPEEFRYFYLSKMPTLKTDGVAKIEAVNRPDSWDWRQKGAVTPVKDQGQCGSCWAFSTTGNVEGQWMLAGHALVSLSEQNLVDCDTLDSGCNGGLPSNAYQYIIQNGIDTEACYPYVAMDQNCQFKQSCATAKVSSWQSVSTDEDAMADFCYQHGPLSVGLNANFLQYYVSGVADPSDCDPQEIDHGVLIIGYGHDGQDFWLVKNSWGQDWGEEGYFRLVRGEGKCGINLMVTTAVA